MIWRLSWRADPGGRAIADRHYNRQKVGSPQFVPPGGCVVLRCAGALWVTSTPLPEYVKHAWPGAWVNSTFRNERRERGLTDPPSSELIQQALAATMWLLGPPPAPGLVTFIDETKIRRKRDPGRCYRRAGFRHVGFTEEDRLWAFQILDENCPAWPIACRPDPPIGGQFDLFGAEVAA